MDADNYFSTARERYNIRLRRMAGMPPPWTDDEIFLKYRFCNVFREHDKTTEWFRTNVRDPLNQSSHVDARLRLVEATMIFRWFNRIETGEIIKDLLLTEWDSNEARRRLKNVHPLVTGAFMIKTETGMSKLGGLLYAIDQARPELPTMITKWGGSIQQVTQDLSKLGGLGPFLSYEIATDLRWTSVLENATDILTWANAGPGCTRGLSVICGDFWKWKRTKPDDQAEMRAVMQELLAMSRYEKYWPQDWKAWELREVEHWACEFLKWWKGKEGGKLKRRFQPV